MAGGFQPLKGTPHQADVDQLYKNESELSDAVNSLQLQINNLPSGPGDTSPFSTLAPCDPYVVDREVIPGRGERIIGCVQFPSVMPPVNLKTVIRKYKKNHINLQDERKKLVDNYDDITDAQAAAGMVDYAFKPVLDFNSLYALWQLVLTDDSGHKIKARAEDSTVPLAIFMTGPPALGNPASHNWFRNGKLDRSKRNATPALTGTPGVEGQECWAWFLNCDRGKNGVAPAKPVTTSAHATPSIDPVWNKASGTLTWGHTAGYRAFGQRLPHRVLRASEIIHVLAWVSRPFGLNPASGTLRITILSQADTRILAADPITRTILATTTVAIGSPVAALAAAVADLLAQYEATRAAAEPTAAPPIVIDPTPVETLDNTSKPVQEALQVSAIYQVSSTPEPNQDSAGQWIEFSLEGVTGSGGFTVDRLRAGRGDGDHTEHPSELDEGQTGPVEVTSGGARGGGSDYVTTPNSLEPGIGAILRARTD